MGVSTEKRGVKDLTPEEKHERDETIVDLAHKIQSLILEVDLGIALDATMMIALGAAAQCEMTPEEIAEYVRTWAPSFVEQWKKKQQARTEAK